MNPLDLLKIQLQNALNESTESEDFKEALDDAAYSCLLDKSTALEQWIAAWTNTEYAESSFNEYARGVKFVEDKWHQITGMF